jgi:hypothetical protein
MHEMDQKHKAIRWLRRLSMNEKKWKIGSEWEKMD